MKKYETPHIEICAFRVEQVATLSILLETAELDAGKAQGGIKYTGK